MSMRGPYPASVHDITIFRGGKPGEDISKWDRDSLYFKMEELGKEKRGVGDSGYGGEPDKIVFTKLHHSSQFKEFLARVKNREETLHTRLKSFHVLEQRF